MKLVTQITALIVLVTGITGIAYKGFSLEQRIVENSRAIVIFSIDKLERLVEELLDQKAKQGGHLSAKDQVKLRRYQEELKLQYERLGR